LAPASPDWPASRCQQIDNVSPNLGQGYIIDSFMVVVFGGVGNLWGTLVGALHARHPQQVPRALCRRGAG
jgi:ribose/xylose/arabinose/galactoside ABC-type transport system permease subunit